MKILALVATLNNKEFDEIVEVECGLFLARVRNGNKVYTVGYYNSKRLAKNAIQAYKRHNNIKGE